MEILCATNNKLKFAIGYDMCKLFGIELVQKPVEIDEIQGEDGQYIILDKVKRAFELLQEPILVTDDMWEIPGLNGFPGAYMKSMNHWFNAQDFINLTSSLTDRRIILHTQLAFYDGKEEPEYFNYAAQGILLTEARGNNGVPSTMITTLDGDNGKTIAEIDDERQAGKIFNEDRKVGEAWRTFAQWYVENYEK